MVHRRTFSSFWVVVWAHFSPRGRRSSRATRQSSRSRHLTLCSSPSYDRLLPSRPRFVAATQSAAQLRGPTARVGCLHPARPTPPTPDHSLASSRPHASARRLGQALIHRSALSSRRPPIIIISHAARQRPAATVLSQPFHASLRRLALVDWRPGTPSHQTTRPVPQQRHDALHSI